MGEMTMKNGDMPAMPVDRCDADAIEVGIQVFSGLTKREAMAMHMMASLTSVYWDTMQEYETGADLVKSQSETAVEMADAILAELERTK